MSDVGLLGDRRLRIALLGAVLLVGLWFRAVPLRGPGPLTTAGDAREYQTLAEFFLEPDQVAPGNRFPGFPFLLAGLFAVLPFAHDVVQVGTTLVLSVVVVALTYALARRLAGPSGALTAAALVSVHPHVAANAHQGLSEELFLVCFLGLLWIYLRLRGRAGVSLWIYAAATVLASCAALVRTDGGYAAIPLAAGLGWQERRSGASLRAVVVRVLPMAILPLLLPKMSQVWMVSLGVQDLDLRLGRAWLWMEFLLGRMPYGYMFYKETTTEEWLLGYHSVAALAVIGVKSCARNLLALGQALGGQLALLVSLVGMRAYLRDHRDLALPLTVPLCMLLQWALMSLWQESDVERYNIRVLPLMLVFLVLGAREVGLWARTRLGPMASTKAAHLPAAALVITLAPGLLPWSLYAAVRPAVDVLYTERNEYLPRSREVHPKLAATWSEFVQGKAAAAAVQEKVESLLAEHEAYAPTHLVLGLLCLDQHQFAEGVGHLERAMEIVPFFAEAGVFLAEAYTLIGRERDALRVLAEVERVRPDFPTIRLERATLGMIRGDFEGARSAYGEYVTLNRYQHERAIIRQRRVLARSGDLASARRTEELLGELDTPHAGLATPFLWNYLGLDLEGIVLPRPEDHTVYYNYGLACARTGRVEEAETHWRTMLSLQPDHAPSWVNLGVTHARQVESAKAQETLRQGLAHAPGAVELEAALCQITSGAYSADDLQYLPPNIVLPMTRTRQ